MPRSSARINGLQTHESGDNYLDARRSPELNPDEFVWNDLKNNSLGRKAITCVEMMKHSKNT